MASVKFHLSKKQTTDGRCHIKLSLSHNGSSALFSTGVFVKPEQWFSGDAETDPYIKKTCTGAKGMNDVINEKLGAVRDRVNALVLDGSLGSFITATQLKNHIQVQLDGKRNC
jgi:hypothetical protein